MIRTEVEEKEKSEYKEKHFKEMMVITVKCHRSQD